MKCNDIMDHSKYLKPLFYPRSDGRILPTSKNFLQSQLDLWLKKGGNPKTINKKIHMNNRKYHERRMQHEVKMGKQFFSMAFASGKRYLHFENRKSISCLFLISIVRLNNLTFS